MVCTYCACTCTYCTYTCMYIYQARPFFVVWRKIESSLSCFQPFVVVTHAYTHTHARTHTHTHTHTLTQTRTDTVWTCWHQRFPSSSSSWSTWQRMRTDQMVSLLAVQVYWGRSSIATVHQIHITLCTCETF